MAEVGAINIGTRQVHIHRFTGIVMDSQRSSETSITGHTNGQIRSHTFHYNEIFLRSADGEERAVEVGSAKVAVRVGNTATVAWGIVGSASTGSYTTVRNHETGLVGHVAKGINDVAGPPGYNMMIIVFVFVGVFSVMGVFSGKMSSIIMTGATGYFFYWLTQRRRVLRAAMVDAVNGTG